jgi:hypothetical protein
MMTLEGKHTLLLFLHSLDGPRYLSSEKDGCTIHVIL